MTILERKFTAQEVAEAAGIQSRSVADWATRGLIVGHGPGSTGRGKPREFTFEQAMQIALAAHLMEAGIKSPKIAFHIAMRFAHSGDDSRNPGMPFHHNRGETWLIVSGDHSRIVLADEHGMIAPERAFPQSLRAFAYITLNLSGLFDRVCAALGAHPNEVLDAAYPEDAR